MKTYNTVKDLEDEDIAFVCDSQEVKAIKENVPITAKPYDSFFVVVENGDYKRLYGMFGTVPWHTKRIYQIV